MNMTAFRRFICFAFMPILVSAFTVKTATSSSGATATSINNMENFSISLNRPSSTVTRSPSLSRLHMSQEKKKRYQVYEESEKRGNILFAFSLLVCVWSFSIPPELRREHFCFSEKCRLDNTAPLCYDCITFSEWTGKVADYYKGGGGIKFDFSIEEK